MPHAPLPTQAVQGCVHTGPLPPYLTPRPCRIMLYLAEGLHGTHELD